MASFGCSAYCVTNADLGLVPIDSRFLAVRASEFPRPAIQKGSLRTAVFTITHPMFFL